MIQIKVFTFIPSNKDDEANFRKKLNSFYEEINKWLEDKVVKPEDVTISDTPEYIFVHIIYKTKLPKKRKR